VLVREGLHQRADGAERRVALEHRDGATDAVGDRHVVAVHAREVGRARAGPRELEGGDEPEPLGAQELDAWILGEMAARDRGALVAGAVVDEQELLHARLGAHARDGLVEPRCDVAEGQDHRDARGHVSPASASR
jgi:hypothetical protein